MTLNRLCWVWSLRALVIAGAWQSPTAGFAATYSAPPTHRVDVDLNSDWRFIRQDVLSAQDIAFDDSAWTGITIPHTWNNLDGQDGGGNYYRGIGWYRRHYTVPNEYAGRRFFLKFEAANIATDVWLNGVYAGQHQGGYAAFVFDVTSYLNVGGDNVFAVKVNNSSSLTNVPPLSADFNFQGGIYRNVHLLVTDPVQVTPLDYGSPGVYLKTANVNSNSADLQITCLISNAYPVAKSLIVRAVVADAETNIVCSLTNTLLAPAVSLTSVALSTVVGAPHLWDGIYDPYRYRVFIEVDDGGTLVDAVSQPLGFRWFSMTPTNGFYLNGRAYDLHGVCMHQDWLDRGWAIGDSERLTNFALIKEIGATTIRLAHYQHNEHTYQLADQNGIVLWTEIPLVNSVKETPEFYANAKQQLRELIRQNLNHPSVVCWGLFNEENVAATNLVRQLAAIAAEEDSTRPSTAASNQGDSSALNWISGIVSFNKYYGWYGGTTNQFGPWADNIHASYPSRCIGVSEYGAGASVWQHSENPSQPAAGGPFHPEEWQNLFHEAHWRQMQARPFLWAKHIWNMFDFAVDGRNEGDHPGRNDKGLVTFDRQIRKDSFFWYKANWTTNPMVYITGHTFTNRQAASITAKVYANCDTVELWLNGVSKGVATSTNRIFTWPVTLLQGSNYVCAVGTQGPTTVTDCLVWTLQQQPYRGRPLSIPGRLQAEEFDLGPEGLAYHDLDTINTAAAFRSNEPVDIETCSDTGGGYDVTSFDAGEWLAYTVAVASSGSYALEFRIASTNSGRTLRLRVDGVDATGPIAVPNTGGLQAWQTLAAINLFLAATQHVLRVETDTGGFNFNWLAFNFRPAPGAFALAVNFQTASAVVPADYLSDTGLVFGDRNNGYRYGWDIDNSANTRERNSTNSPDKRYDTLIHMQRGGTNCAWSVAVPNGRYTIHAVSGDPGYTDSYHSLTAEAASLLSAAPAADYLFIEGSAEVDVTDGLLTIANGTNGNNDKICFIEIAESSGAYQGWRYSWFGLAADDAAAADSADPDQDGLQNLLEYAFNTNPLAPEATPPWQAGLESGHLVVTYQRRKAPTDLTYTVQAADNLPGPWTVLLSDQVLNDDGLMQTVKVTDPYTQSTARQRFVRLKIGRWH